ncbi:hypothetical protein ACFOYW_16065 [Gryllotalpicola reticulitermitis]|uniref:TrbL/VirB6 plasmid conjugal transfer protein n=1 Tax=Gryllotalpicola reticulitermitis TaxID=1184153 RepID=A0ABV8Q971_9MICO
MYAELLHAAASTSSSCTGNAVACAAKSVGGAIGNAANNVGSAVSGAAKSASSAVNSAAGVADFWSDPWGNAFKTLQNAAHGLAEDVLPALSKATLPDLSASWFLKAYAVSFALALFMVVLLILPQIVRTSRGQQAGRDLAESLGLYFPVFLIGSSFGPAAGAFLVKFIGALTDSITNWGIAGSSDSITATFTKMLAAKDATGIAGGAPVGILLMLGMIVGLLLVLLMLIVQLVTLYLTGVVAPLGFLWLVDPRRRGLGTRMAYLWVSILASHPLLFFLLGVVYWMVAGSVQVFTAAPSLQNTVQLVVSIIAIFFAGLSPFILPKIAPVMPFGGNGTLTLPGPTIGAPSTAHADRNASPSSADAGGPSTSSSDVAIASSRGSTGTGGSTAGNGVPSGAEADEAPTIGTAAAHSEAEQATPDATSVSGGTGTSTGAPNAATASTAAEATEAGEIAAAPETGGLTAAAAAAQQLYGHAKKTTEQLGEAAVEPVRDHDANWQEGK